MKTLVKIQGCTTMKKYVIVIFALILVATVFLAGCTNTASGGQDTSAGNLRAHFEYKESWSVGQGCYGKVTGYAFNAGAGSADSVVLNFNLIDTRTGTIRDSRQVFIGSIEPGQSRTYETVLDGECTEDYRVDAGFGK
jgi:predicted small secreted protein